jgi:lysophospholipase L1-like esterase
LDRGNSIRTPFLVQTVGGRRVEYCDPAADDPLLNTIVPGSNTTEWLDELRFHPVVQEALNNPDNKVVLLIIGADIFAEKIDKPPVSIEEYVQNLGKLIQYFGTFDKVTYVAHFPHVRQGSFIKRGEVQPTNEKIDAINQHIDDMIHLNGYLDTGTGQFVSFGQSVIEQDNMRLYINYAQPGPALDQLSDTFPDDTYALDGLHYHAEGYNAIGSAFAEALRAPIEVVQAEWKP